MRMIKIVYSYKNSHSTNSDYFIYLNSKLFIVMISTGQLNTHGKLQCKEMKWIKRILYSNELNFVREARHLSNEINCFWM